MNNRSGGPGHVISLPKGGGALKGIGETFQANPFTGTGNHSIAIAVSPGRNGFGPTLTLDYSSGNGNGVFGLGWQLAIPRITRKTEKGLPRYDDTDVFVLSGAEDLVPCLKKIVDPAGQETWQPEDPTDRSSHTVHRYRPRIEGLFARIERWENKATKEVHWRTITKDNVTSFYGRRSAARISDPENDRRVFEWLLDETFDAAGNHILYEYAKDNPQLYADHDSSLGLNEIFEQRRSATQLYIRRIYYGNLPDPLVDENGNRITYPDGRDVGHLREGRRYAFEVVFDYGDWNVPTKQPHPDPPAPDVQELFGPDPSVSLEQNPVPIRADRFSTFRAGFDIRTLRRCRRVLMFHHFAELHGPSLVTSTDFEYHDDPDTLLSLLAGVTVSGYRRDAAGNYKSASMPPVTFGYSQFTPKTQRYRSVSAEGHSMPPWALNDPNVTLVDLSGDGLPDVLHGSSDGFRYWKNLGGGVLDRPRSMPQIPAGVALSQPGVAFGDVDGDGRADLLVHSGPLVGFFETTADETWKKFRSYDAAPTFDLADRNVAMVDLTGNGLVDALLTGDTQFIWFECLGETGFAPPRQIARIYDLDRFPDVFLGDSAERVRLADMTGDGLTDIVLIHDGRIDYWPNLGYGRFGKRITMENAPRIGFDFRPARFFFADLNGTGCADAVYVDFDRVYFWFNQSGNRWSDQQTITGTPIVSDADSIQFADVFGTGTATLLWTSAQSIQRPDNYKALDFCGGVKPYVLVETSNNMGATTRVSYAPSTRYFLEDQAHGTPWVTKLPFSVQVVDKVEVIDRLSKTKLVTTYKYHHGYFDGREREFRGFGRVDRFDTETFEDFTRPGLHGDRELFNNDSAAYHAPPVETRSWFHTGAYVDQDFRSEYYRGDPEATPIDEQQVEAMGSPHEAYRALRGALLRTEIYAHDRSTKARHPYRVTETRHAVRQLQPKTPNQHGVYHTYAIESFSHHYERNPADPRITHALTLEVDAFGNSLRSIAIGYGRRLPDPGLPTQADRDQQVRTFVTYTENRHTNAIDDRLLDPDNYRAPLPCETRTFELIGFTPANNAKRFSFDEWVADGFSRLNEAVEISYEAEPDATSEQKRLIDRVRTQYRRNDLVDLLPLGILEAQALPGESYRLAFTAGLLNQVYVRNGERLLPANPADVLEGAGADRGGYVDLDGDGNWWLPSGRVFFSPGVSDTPADELTFARRHFFSTRRSRDPFGGMAFAKQDAYELLPTQTSDSVGNRTTAEHDYVLLRPFRVTDPNGNRAEVAFDMLGLVVGTAVMGKVTESTGDTLAGFAPEVTAQQREAFVADPIGNAALLLAHATTRIVYDVDRYRKTGQPGFAAILARETHVSDPLPFDGLKVQVNFSYSDGLGREIQKKIQAEPGPLVQGGPAVSPRWVATGWTLFNNKGKPIKQYEPFFDDTHEFRFGHHAGVTSTFFYDPVERVIATLHPNHTWEKVVFDPWRQESWDVNDTALIADPASDPDLGGFFRRLPEPEYLPTWYAQRQSGTLGPDEQVAAARTALHAATPSIACADSLGRTFLTLAHNRFERNGNDIEEKYATRVVFDIEGNQREVMDARDRVVARYDYDMLGMRIHQASMDAGERWILCDVAGNPIRAWDSRDRRFRTVHDALRRPTEIFLREGVGPERLVGRTVYGESRPDPEANNQRGRVVQIFDQAGVVTTDEYDFKGNLLASRRQLASEYKTTVDWSTSPELEAEVFSARTTYDALNRLLAATSPDGSVYRPTFNVANLLEKVDVNISGAPNATAFVTNIDYNARGQRVLIEYGNGTQTTYAYDPLTFRLSNLRSTRSSDQSRLQDSSYTYDPVGDITRIRDAAQQTIYFNNQVVAPDNDYTYDAVYRLIAAEGREHIGQASRPQTTWDDRFRTKLPSPTDGRAMRRYRERYEYDAADNFLQLIHRAEDGNWTRGYAYAEPSPFETMQTTNRLSATSVGGNNPDAYEHDAHGNMTAMPHLSLMQWDDRDRLQATARQVVTDGPPETTWYRYDASGQRVRKVTERQNRNRKSERIYLGGFEVYREYGTGGTTTTLERTSLHVMDEDNRIAIVETRTQGNDPSLPQVTRYQLVDHLGSASLELDHTGQLISYEEYFSFGATAYQAVRRETETPKRYRYGGKERDEESGFAYHGARYYAPWLGAWVSADPAGFVDGLNVYRYAQRNPIRFSDPSGTETEYTVRSNPEKFFVENANARQNWIDAVEATLQKQFKLGSYENNLAAWEAKINSLPHGPQQINKRLNLGSKEGFARSITNRIVARFYRNEGRRPSWPYSAEQRKLLAKGKAPDPLQQIEHLNDLARNPKNAFNVNDVYLTEGGTKGGIPKDSPHGQKNWGEPGRRLRAAQAAAPPRPAPAAPRPPAPAPAAPATSAQPQGAPEPAGGRAGTTSSDPWAGESSTAGKPPPARGSTAGSGTGRFFRSAGKLVKRAFVVAYVVEGGKTVGSALYHISQGEYGAAVIDVANFATFGGASVFIDASVDGIRAAGELGGHYGNQFVEGMNRRMYEGMHPGKDYGAEMERREYGDDL